MKALFVHEKIKLSIAFISAALIVYFFQTDYSTNRFDKENKFLIPPLPIMLKFTLGYNEVISDIYWIRLLQDMEYCGQEKHSNYLTPEGRRMGRNRTPECRKGWSYQMLDFITELTPRNYLTHKVGGMLLSVIVDDIEGATIIFDKGIQRFPKDWEMLYSAAYHQLAELEDYAKAADLYFQAAENGAPEWVRVLSARLNSKVGRNDLAKTILTSYLDQFDDEVIRKRAIEKLKELEKDDSKKDSDK